MTKTQLVKELEKSDYLLPKDILANIDIRTLEKELVEIYEQHEKKIKEDKHFQRNYIELINYVILIKLRRPQKDQKKTYSNNNFLDNLLSIPELA
jgi:hypothetical protein